MANQEIINELENLAGVVKVLVDKLDENPILPVAKYLRSVLKDKRARQDELMKALPLDELIRYLGFMTNRP